VKTSWRLVPSVFVGTALDQKSWYYKMSSLPDTLVQKLIQVAFWRVLVARIPVSDLF
jgi:hypothetical protein